MEAGCFLEKKLEGVTTAEDFFLLLTKQQNSHFHCTQTTKNVAMKRVLEAKIPTDQDRGKEKIWEGKGRERTGRVVQSGVGFPGSEGDGRPCPPCSGLRPFMLRSAD